VLVNATLVPDTALLVPGAAGAAEVLVDTRAVAVEAVRALLADEPAHVVVVAPGPSDRTRRGPFAPSLAAAGIDDAALGWVGPPHDTLPTPPARLEAPGAAAALLLLAHAGWTGPVTLVEVALPRVADPADAARRTVEADAGGPGAAGTTRARASALAAVGREVTGGPDRVALLVAGSLSARRGPDAPLAEDDRAAALDDAVLADLADGGPDARDRLAALDPGLVAELALTAWAPWAVALGAVDALPPATTVRTTVHHLAAPFAVTYTVVSWRTA
jgi:hypothetical protein